MATASKVVFYSASPFGTGDIKTGSPTLTISSGVATLTVAQTGNIGAGDCIDFGGSNTKVYIAPCRIAFTSGWIEIKIHDKLKGLTSGATGIVRAVEVTSGSWIGGDAAGYIYFRKVTGTWNSSETIRRIMPNYDAFVAYTNSNLQGNMSTTFVVKDPDGTETDNVGSAQTVNSIHHVAASLDAVDALYTGASYINNTNLTSGGADVLVHICGYYDHDDQTIDSTILGITSVTTDTDHYLYYYTPQGDKESINDQRHDGKWNANKYILEPSSGTVGVSAGLTIIRFEGFQLYSNSLDDFDGINCAATLFYVSHNIIKATISGGDSDCRGIVISSTTTGGYVWNNIIYDWENGSKFNVGIYVNTGAKGYVYNNTVYNCYDGIYDGSGTNTLYIKNNIVQDCYNENYVFAGAAISTHNIGNGAASELAFGVTYKIGTTNGTTANKLIHIGGNLITAGTKIGCVVMNTTDTTYTRVTALDSEDQLTLADDIFVSGENYYIFTNKIGDVTFNNEGADDFHLGAGDAFAKNLGINLSADSNIAFWDDIDGDERL